MRWHDGAVGVVLVRGQLHAQRGLGLRCGRGLDGLDVGGRRRRRLADDGFQHPLAAMHRAMPRAIGGEAENGRLREQSAAMIFRPQRDALEAIFRDVGNLIVLGEPRVEHRPVRIEELAQAEILSSTSRK